MAEGFWRFFHLFFFSKGTAWDSFFFVSARAFASFARPVRIQKKRKNGRELQLGRWPGEAPPKREKKTLYRRCGGLPVSQRGGGRNRGDAVAEAGLEGNRRGYNRYSWGSVHFLGEGGNSSPGPLPPPTAFGGVGGVGADVFFFFSFLARSPGAPKPTPN
ncbi:uncharacterized protein TM35_000132450 [Trypanosoma theileri]|uniref:Uncharacterized protein n=1 Tax=Trypanosoma theileri TaxID=67003 RepID=A0A1X0NXA9_9TRYP|nr:uncharacterized protein TM35_000132450 [Trypanosoma theileri]ORC89241.1 hypothetical protein TM35_000132450 [Trypanosoma theileri]